MSVYTAVEGNQSMIAYFQAYRAGTGAGAEVGSVAIDTGAGAGSGTKEAGKRFAPGAVEAGVSFGYGALRAVAEVGSTEVLS